MSFSYLSTAPASSARSWLRLRLADTSSGSPKFQDEELDGFLSVAGNQYLAAAEAAETLGAQFAGKVDRAVGRLRISYSQAGEHYFRLAKRLRTEAAMRVAPYSGGISDADKAIDIDDADRVAPAFAVGQFDLPGIEDPATT